MKDVKDLYDAAASRYDNMYQEDKTLIKTSSLEQYKMELLQMQKGIS